MKQILKTVLFPALVLMLLFSCTVTAGADTIDVTDFSIDDSAPDRTIVTWNESADAVLKNEAQAGYPAAMTIGCKFGSAYALYVSDAAGTAVDRVMPSSIADGKITFEIPGAGVYHILQGNAPVTTYTVTFHANGHGTAPAAQTGFSDGGKVTEPTAPAADGYTFGGWYREAACTTAWNFSTDTVTGDITLYARWIPNTQTSVDGEEAESYQPQVVGLDKILQEQVKENPGQPVHIKLTLAEMTDSQVPAAEKTAIQEAAEKQSAKNIVYLDISLTMTIGNGTPVDIGGENDQLITITLDLPAANRENFCVFRYHGDDLHTLTTAKNSDGEYMEVGSGKLILHAKKFSTYAIGYSEVYTMSNISWIRSSGKDASAVAEVPKAEFEAVYVDGKLVSSSSYTLSGTDKTTITFKNSYLKTLSTGKHILEVTSSGGRAESQLTVKKPTVSANTGDQFNLILWVILMAVCLTAAVTLLILRKKRKK